jgi:hypothetical protein
MRIRDGKIFGSGIRANKHPGSATLFPDICFGDHPALGESGVAASGRTAALCVTFGAPLFGDEAARRFLSVERQFAASMFHFVGEKDPVPSLLSLAHSVSAAKRLLEDKVRCDHSCFRDMLFF